MHILILQFVATIKNCQLATAQEAHEQFALHLICSDES